MAALNPLPPEPSDRVLLIAARDGDEASLQAFCRRRFPWMRRIARLEAGDAAAADDGVQDAMISLIRHLHQWDPSRPFEPWLATVVRNAVRAQHRRWRPWEPLAERLGWRRDDRVIDLDRATSATLAAFDDLAPGQRQALYHVDVLQMDIADVAELLGIAPSTVRVQLHRGRTTLRARLDGWRHVLEIP